MGDAGFPREAVRQGLEKGEVIIQFTVGPSGAGKDIRVVITIPVVTQTVALNLPKETNIARQTRPENIEISVNKDGDVFWNAQFVPDHEALFQRLKKIATLNPQPEVHIRGDESSRYENIGRVVFACQRAAIQKISFVTEPPPKG